MRCAPFCFTAAGRDFEGHNARYLVEKGLVRLPLEPDVVRRTFLNVQSTEKGYGHPDRTLIDVFDAVQLALRQVRGEMAHASFGIPTARGRTEASHAAARSLRPR